MRFMLIVLAAACGASSPPAAQPAAPDAPQLLGRPVALERLQEPMAVTAYAYAQQALAEGQPTNTSIDGILDWLEQRTRMIALMDGTLSRLPESDQSGLFQALLLAVVIDDLIGDITKVPEPSDVDPNYSNQIDGVVKSLAKRAARFYNLCSQLMPYTNAALQVWGDYCRTRSDELAFVAIRPSSASKPH